MSLDDLARRAAEQSREHAASGGDLDPERYRRRRERRNQARALVLSAAFVVVLLLIGILASPPEDEVAVTASTLPREITTTTLPVTTTTTGVPPGEPGGILGAGWEALDPGPIAGRYRMASVRTDFGLFVFGGHDNYSQEGPPNVLFHSDAFLYDPVDETWRALAEIPREVFEIGEPQAVAMGGSRVFVYGRPRAPGSGHAAIYDLEADDWVAIAREFGDALGPPTQVVWTGELLVATNIALAYDPATGATLTHLDDGMMATPADADAGVHSPQRAHWTGSEILVVGSGPAYAWVPGEEAEWRTLAQPPVPDRARDSVWTDQGLLVVNYQMATAVLDPEANVWSRSGDLPLRFSECSPDALAVSSTPVVRMCSGLAIWDEVRGSWIPVPLGRYGGSPEWGWSDLVAAEDEIFSIGGEEFLRYRISRDEDGRIVPPPTVPIGVMLLDVPDGFVLAESFAPEQDPEGVIPEDETIGLVFWPIAGTSGPVCTVSSSDAPDGFVPPGDLEDFGGVQVSRPGRTVLHGTAYHKQGIPIAAAFPDANGSDVVFIRCSEDVEASEAMGAFAAGLWSPWEEPLVPDRDLLTGIGWEEVYGGPVAGRGNLAAVGTGTHIFVWGVGLEAYLFDPATETWRATSRPPPGFCLPTRVSVTWIDETVVVHGAGGSGDGCSRAVSYHPVTDTWTLLGADYFDRVSYSTAAVWTGEWLAAPSLGLAWVASTGETIRIPVVPYAGWAAARFHWTGDKIIALGLGDVYTLVPGEDEWSRLPGPPLPAFGRDSVLAGDELFVVQYDNLAARSDLAGWEEINLPLRFWECDLPELLLAGDLPVVRVCSGLAIWDDVRGYWVPIPLDVDHGTTWRPFLVGTDDAIYSVGEKVLRYPISRTQDDAIDDPPTIPVGVMQLDIPIGFRLRTTTGVSSVALSDGSAGEVVTFVFGGPGGSCLVDAWYGGRELPEDQSSIVEEQAEGEWLTARLSGTEPSGYWLVAPSLTDTIWIDCESPDDAETLAKAFWLP